jgi:hypothetical protein
MLPGAVIGQDAALELLRAAGLEVHLALQPLGDAGHLGERQVVLRHARAELLPGRLHQRLGVGLLETADEQAEEAADEPSNARKHADPPVFPGSQLPLPAASSRSRADE